jgi:probable HAF family extracellular repeat protein
MYYSTDFKSIKRIVINWALMGSLLAFTSVAQASIYNFTTLDVPNANFTDARGINNSGRVVGTFSDPNGGYHGFVATPAAVPLPAAAWLFVSALAGLIGFAGRKARQQDLDISAQTG